MSTQHYIALTIDYETWHPVPEGKRIDWEQDVFTPTERLMEACAPSGAKLTLMAEMGEYFWLKQYDPPIAQRMERQWAEAIRQGHDVQLHLHPCWLPETGAKFERGEWWWDWSLAKANDYPGDLTELIARCKAALENALCPIKPNYAVTSFRAGTYQVQPFKRLYDALTANDIGCDSSVFAGGCSQERGYDFRFAYSSHQPYFANAFDPQLKAPPGEQGVVELPVFTFARGQRWFLDNQEGALFAGRLLKFLDQEGGLWPDQRVGPLTRKSARLASRFYYRLPNMRPTLNAVLPKPLAHAMTPYAPESLVQNRYFVLIGHTKANLDYTAIAANLECLRADGRFTLATLSDMARAARQELLCTLRQDREAEAAYQVQREYRAIMGEERNTKPSFYLQEQIPLDRKRALDLGCGAGYWSERIANLYPWMQVVGIDAGEDFIAKAQQRYASERVSFQVADFANLPFEEGAFDCVYADNTLEHSFDVSQTLREVRRVLCEGGALIAAFPSDARNPIRICDNHTWKTAPHEVKMRLEDIGFVNVTISEVDIFRRFGMQPYPPSDDRMMYIRAWKRERPFTERERALEAMDCVYRALLPEKSQQSNDAVEILQGGYAYCWGYAVVLGRLLQREGYDVRWLTMLANGHPRGRGLEQTDSHEVLLVMLDGKECILDPMANTLIPHALAEVLANPALAPPKAAPDARYQERGYWLYDSEFFYSRIVKYRIRRDPSEGGRHWQKR
jgi:ubiquinone/menaquinone biosynthesis C-methylase UbiE